MRIARGISAICLLVIFVVMACDVLVKRPLSDQDRVSVVRYRRITNFRGNYLSMSSWMVSSVGVSLQIHGNWDHLTC